MKIICRHNVFIRCNHLRSDRQSIWFLHGFADSGLAYKDVFKSAIGKELNIYVVDLPGFGVSPIQPDFLSIKEQSELLSKIIVEETKDQQAVNIVAHSLGGLIGTWICKNLKGKINHYFNIEGNLTTADSYFSSKPLDYETAEAFAESFKTEIFEKAKSEERFKNYYSSLRFAEPEGMRNWGFSSQEYIEGNQCGYEFKELACQKLYIWGDLDTPIETQNFIQEESIPNQLYKGIGHWHMIENAECLYSDILERIKMNQE